MDRIDLHVQVPALSAGDLLRSAAGESSAIVRARCIAARERALARQGKTNQALVGQEIYLHAALDATTSTFVQTAAVRLGWSARSTHRTLKIARSIADLAGSAAIGLAHAAEAMQYRHSGPGAL
jgi:magnesium chelatase family protein